MLNLHTAVLWIVSQLYTLQYINFFVVKNNLDNYLILDHHNYIDQSTMMNGTLFDNRQHNHDTFDSLPSIDWNMKVWNFNQTLIKGLVYPSAFQ